MTFLYDEVKIKMVNYHCVRLSQVPSQKSGAADAAPQRRVPGAGAIFSLSPVTRFVRRSGG